MSQALRNRANTGKASPADSAAVAGATASSTGSAVVPSSWSLPSLLSSLSTRQRWYLVILTLVLGTFVLYRFYRWIRWQRLTEFQQDLFAVDSVASSTSSSSSSLDDLDGLIVLGCSVNHYTGVPSSILTSRVELAVEQACARKKSHPFDFIMFSGGSSWEVPIGLPSEAEIMQKTFEELYQKRVDRTPHECPPLSQMKLMTEKTSTSTMLNARYSLSLLLEDYESRSRDDISASFLHRTKKIGIVTSRFHQWRSIRTFQRIEQNRRRGVQEWQQPHLHFEFSIVPMSTEHSHNVSQLEFWRECLAIALYWVRRFI